MELFGRLGKYVVVPHDGGQREVYDDPHRFKVLNCGRRYGKFFRLDQPILTPTGWVRMGEIREGQQVVGSDGQPTTVTGVFPQGVRPLAIMTLKCGTKIVCGYDHQWLVRRRWRRGRENATEVLTTRELLDEGLLMPGPRREHRFAIPAPSPAAMTTMDLPLPPYTLGALLGDGSLQGTPVITSDDPEIPERIRSELEGMATVRRLKPSPDKCGQWSVSTPGPSTNPVTAYLRSEDLNVRSEHKHVPADYLVADAEQRLALLQGLMDTDGWLEGPHGRRCAFASASSRLAYAVRELALSLGGKVTPIQQKPTTHLDSWVLRFYMPAGQCPFSLRRKASRWTPTPPERLARQIVSIEPTAPAKSQCIAVDADDCLYLTRDYTLTHNTKLGVKMMLRAALVPPEKDKKERLVWWVAPTYRVVKRGYAETMRQLPRELLTHDPPPATNFDSGRPVTLRLKNGNSIEFYSAERPGGMLGEGVDFAVMDEAATIPSNVWEQVIRPTLMDSKGGGVLISTPRGRNWFHKRYQAGQDPQDPNWASWTFTSYANPHIDDSEIDEMKAELPALLFAQEVLAKFVADGSNVFGWDERAIQTNSIRASNNLVEGIKVRGHVFLGVDLARTNDYTVLYGANEDNMRNVYFERFNALRWKEQRRRIRRAVSRLEQAGASAVTLVMDTTGVGDPIVEDMEDAGYDVIPINFTTFKNKMVMRLAKDLETGRAFLLAEARLEEFEDYQLSSTKTNRITYGAPEGSHDDAVSAKMLSHWGITAEGSPEASLVTGREEDTPAGTEEDPGDPEDVDYSGDADERSEWGDLLCEDDEETAGTAAPPNLTPEEQFAAYEAREGVFY